MINKIVNNKKRVFFFLVTAMLLFSFIFFLTFSLSNDHQNIFLMVGDLGNGSLFQKKILSKLSYQIIKKCSEDDCDAFFVLGDVFMDSSGVKNSNSSKFINDFEFFFEGFTKPTYIVLGNRDYDGNISAFIDYSRKSSLWRLPGKYYYKKFDNVIAYVVDTNDFSEEQRDWLKTILNKNAEDSWQLVVGHHPLTSYAEYHSEEEDVEMVNSLRSVLCEYGVDLYISAHDHALLDLGSYCQNKSLRSFVAGGGGAPLSTLKSNNLPFSTSDYGFLKVVFEERLLKIELINLQGDIVYSWGKNI